MTRLLSADRKHPKKGRGSQRLVPVAVMAESAVLQDYMTGEKDKSCRYFKMVKIENLKAKTAKKLVKVSYGV